MKTSDPVFAVWFANQIQARRLQAQPYRWRDKEPKDKPVFNEGYLAGLQEVEDELRRKAAEV